MWYEPAWDAGERISDWRDRHRNVLNILSRIDEGGIEKAVSLYAQNDLGKMQIRIRRQSVTGKWNPFLEPASLMHLIWLEIGLTITGEATIKRCQVCNAPMLIGGAMGGKQNRMTCSSRCRFAAYKKRRELAAGKRSGPTS